MGGGKAGWELWASKGAALLRCGGKAGEGEAKGGGEGGMGIMRILGWNGHRRALRCFDAGQGGGDGSGEGRRFFERGEVGTGVWRRLAGTGLRAGLCPGPQLKGCTP